MAQAQALDDYFRRLERELDCPAKYRSELVARARKRAEDYLLDQSDAGSQDMDLLLGDPKELAQSMLETLDRAAQHGQFALAADCTGGLRLPHYGRIAGPCFNVPLNTSSFGNPYYLSGGK